MGSTRTFPRQTLEEFQLGRFEEVGAAGFSLRAPWAKAHGSAGRRFSPLRYDSLCITRARRGCREKNCRSLHPESLRGTPDLPLPRADPRLR